MKNNNNRLLFKENLLKQIIRLKTGKRNFETEKISSDTVCNDHLLFYLLVSSRKLQNLFIFFLRQNHSLKYLNFFHFALLLIISSLY